MLQPIEALNVKVGYAVKDEKGLRVETVSSTSRAAKVAWLEFCAFISVFAKDHDVKIAEMFTKAAKDSACVVRVQIMELPS